MGGLTLTLLTKGGYMTSKDLSIFNSLRPFSVGYDSIFDQFESMLGNGSVVQSNYPPYNIRKAGKDKYAIEVAVAGFNKDDVEVEYEDNLLTLRQKMLKEQKKKRVMKLFIEEYRRDLLLDHLQLQMM